MKRLELVRDVLDMQVVDRDGEQMGRVDGLALELRGDQPPRVRHLEMGFAVLARRVHPRCEAWLERLRRRFSVRKTARYRVEWSQVKEIDPHYIRIDVEANATPTFDWERWLRKHVISRLPGAAK